LTKNLNIHKKKPGAKFLKKVKNVFFFAIIRKTLKQEGHVAWTVMTQG
jgi:hypothetical protein